MKLIDEMKRQLPIPANLTKDLASSLSKKGKDISADTELMIREVFDSGDEGGIVCLLDWKGDYSLNISLTLLRVKPNHPLFDRISAYQRRRIRKIFRSRGLKAGRS
jgi:hypothetical protein